MIWVIDVVLLEHQYGFRPHRGRLQSLSVLQRLIESGGTLPQGVYALFIDLEQCFDRIPRRRLWRALRRRGLPKKFVLLLRDLYTNTRCRVRSEDIYGDWFNVSRGVRQGSIEGPILANIYIDCMMREVLGRCPQIGVRIHYRLDGRWVEAEDMTHEQRIACLMYADDCAIFATSEHEIQRLYDELQVVFRRDGMHISIEKTEASIYITWISPAEWLEPQVTHHDGTTVKESLASKYLGQRKERRGADKEVGSRLGGPLVAWRPLKGKIFRNKNLPVALRIKLYDILVTSQLLSAAEAIPLPQAEQRRMEVLRTSHLRQMQFVPYTAHCPNHAVRRTAKTPTVESLLTHMRLRLWGTACRDSPHSLFRATMFGQVAEEEPKKRPATMVTLQSLIKKAVGVLQESLKLRDWSLDPALLVTAQESYTHYYHAGPGSTWEKKRLWWHHPDTHATLTPGDQASRNMWATQHEYWEAILGRDLRAYRLEMGIHPTRSLEAVSHLALRPKLFNHILKLRIPSYEASTDPLPSAMRGPPTITCPHCTDKVHTLGGLTRHCYIKHPEITPSPASSTRITTGVKFLKTKKGKLWVRTPQRNQAASWGKVKSTACPDCGRKCESIGACRRHWSNVCSHPLVKKCPGCQLLIKTAALASYDGGKSVTRPYVCKAIRQKARGLHNCMADPAKAPLIARQSMGRAGVAKPPRAVNKAKPAGPRHRFYQLLPPPHGEEILTSPRAGGKDAHVPPSLPGTPEGRV